MADMTVAVRSAMLLVGSMVVMAMAMVGSSQAYDFYVGGRDGWVQQPKQNYTLWAESIRFQVNDSLVFKYRPGEDSVLVVNKQDFDVCDTTRPTQKLDGGNTIFRFDRSGPFFFISGVPGRCQAGQKLVVVVMSPRGRAASAPPPPTAAAPSPPTTPAGSAPSSNPERPPTPAPSQPSVSAADASLSRAAALFPAAALLAGAFLLW